jgi:alginate O-acetyltransferase complex protein AlgI
MVFSDSAFVFLFLPLALLGLIPASRFFAPAAIIFSMLFYAWSSGAYVLILAANIALNFRGGIALEEQDSAARKRRMLIALICANLAPLFYFKYAFFALSQVPGLLDAVPIGNALKLALPVGISFFVFQGVSYVADVHAGRIRAERNFAIFAAYASFFPHLAAGPIVRFADVAADFRKPARSADLFAAGAARFAHGFIKKTLIADQLAPIADACFAFPSAELSFGGAWAGAIAYSLQIYFDFSAYSDMAIGLALMLGVRFAENFLRPYASSTVTEFWRRWHVSLSGFFRDYVYIPMGGNRNGALATHRNLLIVFALTGLWHGASFTFVLWGLYHGAFLSLERLIWGSRARNLGHMGLRLCYCVPVVTIGWVLFRSASVAQAGAYLQTMLLPFSVPGLAGFAQGLVPALDAPMVTVSPPRAVVLLLACAAYFLPANMNAGQYLMDRCERLGERALRLAYMGVALAVGGGLALAQNYSPFLYFQF